METRPLSCFLCEDGEKLCKNPGRWDSGSCQRVHKYQVLYTLPWNGLLPPFCRCRSWKISVCFTQCPTMLLLVCECVLPLLMPVPSLTALLKIILSSFPGFWNYKPRYKLSPSWNLPLSCPWDSQKEILSCLRTLWKPLALLEGRALSSQSWWPLQLPHTMHSTAHLSSVINDE